MNQEIKILIGEQTNLRVVNEETSMRKADPAKGTGGLGLSRPLHGDRMLEEGEEQGEGHHHGLHLARRCGNTC